MSESFSKKPINIAELDLATPRSPCVRNCCLNDLDICLGCGRSLSEIVGWSSFSDEEKKKVLVNISKRVIR